MAREFTLQSIFKLGYRNKEDISNNPPYVLSVGSQNVLTNAAEQVVIRNGYQLDGPAGTQNTYGVDSAYDFNTFNGGIRNLRKWGTNLEMRHKNPSTGAVSWINLLSTLVAANVANFCSYWEAANSKVVALFVNGDKNVYRWTGAMGSFLSATSNSITVSGTTSLTKLNFDQTGFILVNGVKYSYTGAGIVNTSAYSQTPTNATVAINNTNFISQKFTSGGAAVQLTTVTLKLHVNNIDNTLPSVPNVEAYLFTDNAGVPGTLLTSAIATPSAITTGDYTLSFTFNYDISPATNYHLAFNTLWPVTNDGSWVFSTYIGVAGGVGTNTGVSSGSGLPASWSASNGYLNMTVSENDASGTTFTTVSPDPTSVTINLGDAIVQAPQIGASSITSCTLPTLDLIGIQRNQVYYGSFTDNTVFISKVDNYLDASFTTPVRVVGEGASLTLDAPPTAFISQQSAMYISAGRSFWYGTEFLLSSDLAKESLVVNPLKVASSQGAFSQSYVGKLKNSIVFISNEPLFNAFGLVKNIQTDPQVSNMSDSIKYDMDAYTFGGGSVHYNNYMVYFSVPHNGVVRVFNVNKKYWEAPQTMPVGMFYEVDGALYGHDANTDASYQLFVPGSYNDVGQPIPAMAAFPYVASEGAEPAQKKAFNKFFTEGYISSNSTLTVEVNYDFGAFNGSYSDSIIGSDKSIIFNKITDGSLGKNPLGTQPIGTILNLPQPSPIPKFRKISTFPFVNNFEYQIVFSSNAVDYNWAILRFGPAVGPARDIPVEITQ